MLYGKVGIYIENIPACQMHFLTSKTETFIILFIIRNLNAGLMTLVFIIDKKHMLKCDQHILYGVESIRLIDVRGRGRYISQ